MECPIWTESAVCDQAVEVRVPIYITAKCLDSRNHPRDSTVISHCRLHHLSYCLRCTHTTAMSNCQLLIAQPSLLIAFLTDPLRKDRRAFGMTGGAERTGLAREGQQVFIVALIAADACKPLSEDAAI